MGFLWVIFFENERIKFLKGAVVPFRLINSLEIPTEEFDFRPIHVEFYHQILRHLKAFKDI